MIKTSLKTITLYEIIIGNHILLLCLIYNIMVLIFNHYAIKHFEYLKINYSGHALLFNSFQHDLNMDCLITILVSIVMLCIPKLSEISNYWLIRQSDVYCLMVGYIGCVVKFVRMLTDKKISTFIFTNQIAKYTFGFSFDTITFSYLLQLCMIIPIGLIIFGSIVIFINEILVFFGGFVVTFTQKLKFQYIEKVVINDKEIV